MPETMNTKLVNFQLFKYAQWKGYFFKGSPNNSQIKQAPATDIYRFDPTFVPDQAIVAS